MSQERYFYFSRKTAPHPLAGGYLVSGVLLAETEERAREKLGAEIDKHANLLDRASDFAFSDLDAVERVDHGLIAITTATN
jgi:hypothetical protein